MGKRLTAGITVALAAILLTGCAPSHADVKKQIVVELESVTGIEGEWDDLASGLADDALAGNCGSYGYRTALQDPGLIYVWDLACTTHFEGDMSEGQITEAKDNILNHILESVEE